MSTWLNTCLLRFITLLIFLVMAAGIVVFVLWIIGYFR